MRASAQSARERALEDAERELTAERRELEELRNEIRAARASERARKAEPSTPAAQRAERERDRRLGAASERVRRASTELSSLATVRQTAPLGVGDPVISPSLGVRGTIVEIAGDEAEVHAGALRVRVPLARLSPDPQGRALVSPEPDVHVRASAPSDVSDELDVRGGAPTTRARPHAPTSMPPTSPGDPRCASSMAAEPARCARRCVTSSPVTPSSTRRSRTAQTARRSSGSPDERHARTSG